MGDPAARLLVVGLAPGMHGANRTGIPFAGDGSGTALFQSLYRAGFSTHPDGLDADRADVLRHCRITNAVKCLPPQNRPRAAEIRNCNPFLRSEIQALARPAVVLALGTVAHQAVVQALGLSPKAWPFGHHRRHEVGEGLTLLDSYHCSRYNLQTRRLTPSMLDDVLIEAHEILKDHG